MQPNSNSTLDALVQARRVLADTEDAARNVTHELARQREVLDHPRVKAHATAGLLDHARVLLRRMRRRVSTIM
jgi:hypothetical protein